MRLVSVPPMLIVSRSVHEKVCFIPPTNTIYKYTTGPDWRMSPLIESAVADVNDSRQSLLDTERAMVRAALIEQRAQYCHFVGALKPVLV
jgi:hypothetical protein